MNKYLSTLVHAVLLPRGRNFVKDTRLETGWCKQLVFRDGHPVSTFYKYPKVKPWGMVILAHPNLSAARQFFLTHGHTEMYLNLGLKVIIFDFNGFGDSPFKDFNYADDIAAVAGFYASEEPLLPVFGHGVSFGAAHVITYSTYTDALFRKIIIENCLDSNLSYYKVRNRKLYFVMRMIMKGFPNVNRNHNYIQSISKLTNIDTVLLIYNTEDDLTTIDMGKMLLRASNKQTTWEVFKGRHLYALQDNREHYISKIKQFLSS